MLKDYKLILSPKAGENLQEIFDYHIKNDTNARKVTANLIKSILILKEFPKLGNYVFDRKLKRQKYRVYRFDKYLCFYKIANKTINIDTIIHSARDYFSLIKK